MKKIFLITLTFVFAAFLNAQVFIDVNAGLTGISNSYIAWGDYDNDSDLDILMCGQTTSGTPVTKIYNNDNGSFTNINAGLAGVTKGAAVWGDYDIDGDLDILITGENSDNKTFLYRNDNGNFTEVSNNFEYFGDYSFAAWGDYDNDGDQDICITGNWKTKIYRNNDDHSFSDSEIPLFDLSGGRADWADYDGDGDLDLLLTGDTGGGKKAYIYKNNDGTFEEILLEITGLGSGAVKWGDYDSDGDFDILIMGFDDYIEQRAFVYRNDGNDVFTNIYAGLAPVAMGSAAWGDFDNDGDLDIALTGKLAGCGSFTSAVYENVGNDFFNQVNNANLTAAERSFVCWGDFDNDSDLDLILSGINSGGSSFTTVYRNDGSLPNFAPGIPENLSFTASGGEVVLSWDKANDTQTPQDGLTYNVCLGSQSGVYDIISPSAMNTGYREIPAFGNTSLNNMMKIKGLVEGDTYYWTVQTLDNTFEGSEFAPEQSFTVIYTGVSQMEEQAFSLSPNPSTGKFEISNLKVNTGNAIIKIYDKTGKIMKKLTVSGTDVNIVVDASEWSAGLYFVTVVIDQKETATRKIMVK
jgi:predicted nucleotidyltransferase